MALLVVLVILLVVAASSASFIWFMNQQQARAGARYRAALAVAAAEAGVHRALSILESATPDGKSPGRTWRPTAYSEIVQEGSLESRFTLSLADELDGAIQITSIGEAQGVMRRLRARVYLASPALLAALSGAGFIRVERRPTFVSILPYGEGMQNRPWVHIAAGRGVWFATSDVSINDPSWVPRPSVGPLDAPTSADLSAKVLTPKPIRLLLARSADLSLDQDKQRVDVQQLRAMGMFVDERVLRVESFPRFPDVDRAYYQALAIANAGNADLNEAAGKYFGDMELARKSDSLYSLPKFQRIMAYLGAAPRRPNLSGVIYVTGGVALADGQQLLISGGSLITEGPVYVMRGGSLEITHTAATRTMPGVLALGNGMLIVSHGARFRVHGLVYSSRTIDVTEDSYVDIVGAVLGDDPDLSFRSYASTILIRYDPAVLGTPGLRVPADSPVVAWVAAWEELEGPATMIPPVPPMARPETPRRSEPAAPVPPPASPVLPSPTAPPAAAPIAPSPQALRTTPSPQPPAVVMPRREQSPVDKPATQAVGPSPGELPAQARSSRRVRIAASPREQGLFTVQVGAFSIRGNAEELITALRRDGLPARIVVDRGLYKVRIGAFHNGAQAEELADQLRARGYAVIIVR